LGKVVSEKKENSFMVRHFRDLIAWQRAMDLVVQVYGITEPFSSKEMFGLTNQLRRAAVSVPSNIAEGQGRNTTIEFLRYLSISRGSLQEVQTQVEIAYRLGYLDETTTRDFLESSEELARILNGLCRSLTPEN
jgi:four helix bundle protein